jgi:hypothetical protein
MDDEEELLGLSSSSSSSDGDLANYRPSQLGTAADASQPYSEQSYAATPGAGLADSTSIGRASITAAELDSHRALLASLSALDKQDVARHLMQFHLVQQVFPPERLSALSGSRRKGVRRKWARWPLPLSDLVQNSTSLRSEIEDLVTRQEAEQARAAGQAISDEEETPSYAIVAELVRFVESSLVAIADLVAAEHPHRSNQQRMQAETWKTVLHCMPRDRLPEPVRERIQEHCRLLFDTSYSEGDASSLDLSDDDNNMPAAPTLSDASSSVQDTETSDSSDMSTPPPMPTSPATIT